jgi:HK97 gp10 family phage protein
LRRLSANIGRKIARKAARAAMKPIHKSAVTYAPRDTGLLAKGIKLRAAKSRKRGSIAFEVRTEGEHSYIAVFNEYGTIRMPPRPFMRRALDEHKQTSTKILLDEMWRGIRAELR